MQSDRITFVVEPSRVPFQVPQDLLMQWSLPLGNMCQSGLEESRTRVIPLPHVKISTFEDFFIWMHAYEPSVNLKSLVPILDLAIFAEIYIIYHLKNQTSDILRTELGSGRWQLTPDNISMIYDEVPSGSILRQLCSISLALPVADPTASPSFGSFANSGRTHRQHNNYLEWESVFEKHSDLGWDYFRHIQTGHTQTAINWGGPCRFHDHRDIPGVKLEDANKCPYPLGALPTERHTQSLSNEYQSPASVEAQPVGNEEEAQHPEEPSTVEGGLHPTGEEPQSVQGISD
ncbi:hypothetical protein B7463_g9360, partial [Scytalidium lignicola]